MYSSVVETVFHHATNRPDALAVADKDKALTYSRLWECICQSTRWFAELGVQAHDYALVECDQSVEYIVCLLALQLMGATPVPLEKNAAIARQIEIASDTNARLIIAKTQKPELDSLCYANITQVCNLPSYPSSSLAFPDSESVAEILFSTGTTGKSKGIVITRRNNMAIAESIVCGVQMN